MLFMKALIVGCGYVGGRLAEVLLDQGHEVWGLKRDVDSLKALEGRGLKPLAASLMNPGSLTHLPPAELVVLCQAPSREADNYRDTYHHGTEHLLESLSKKPKKIILISSTSVYGAADGSWVDESDDPAAKGFEPGEPGENARALLDMEKLVLRCGVPAVVFRLGGIYGPGRNRVKALVEGLMEPVFSENYTNRIHVEDVVSGILFLAEKGRAGEVYLGVDDYPCTQREFYGWLCDKLSLLPPADRAARPAAHASNKRCMNKKIKKLGLAFKYPTFKEGYQELLRAELGVRS